MTEHQVDEAIGFERFVARRGRDLWRAAWLLTNDSQHAEDLVQTALAKTWGRYDAIGNDAQFEAYVRTTIYRTFVSWWRKMSWRNERPSETLADSASAEGSAHLRMDLMRALDELPRMQRAVLVLHYFEDLSIDEIAKQLGVSSGTVKTHSSRGRAALRDSAHLIEAGVLT